MKTLSIVLVGLLVAACAMPLVGQTVAARLEGVVKDASSAVIPNAKVTAIHSETGTKSEAVTNSQGFYIIPSVSGGTYTITVEATGFRKSVTTGLIVLAGNVATQDITMAVGAVTESVTVQATQAGVQTAESHIGRNVTLSEVDTLPQLARTPITLAIYQPGVQMASGDTSFSHVNGLRQGSNNSTLDGIDVSDSIAPRIGLSLTANNSDSVEEVRLITAGGKAEYGHNAGGQIEMVTRSGTNQFHGNLFDYIRNTDVSANDFFNNLSGVARPVLIQNIFGGSVGGPVKKDKLFFFFNTQMRRTTQQIVTTRTVLTDLAKSGIFQWKNPSTGLVQQQSILTEDPRAKGIDPTVAAEIKQLPEPNNTSVGDGLNSQGYQFNAPSGGQENQITAKGDYNWKPNVHFFARYSRQTNFTFDALNSAQQTYPGQPSGTQGGIRWGTSVGMDWTITPSMVNEFRFGNQSGSVDFLRPGRLQGPEIIPNSYSSLYFTGFPQGRNSPVNEFTDNLSKVHGNHTFKVGFNSRWTTQFGYNDAGIWANLNLTTGSGNTVSNAVTPGNGASSVIGSTDVTRYDNLYNDLLGRLSTIPLTYYSNLATFQAQGTPQVLNYVLREYGAFAQDDWRIKPNLTLNIGVRWEFNTVPQETGGQQGTFDQAASVSSSYQSSNLTVLKSGAWFHDTFNHFAPRFGFAWDPFKKGKTSIRGDYGIFNDRTIGAAYSTVSGNTPGFVQTQTSIPNPASNDVRIGDGLSTILPPAPGAPLVTLPALGARTNSIVLMNPNLTNGYVQQFSLNVQHELARNLVMSVGYVGTRGTKLYMDEDMNQEHIYGDFLTSFNQLAALGSATPATNTLVKIFGSAAAATSAIGSSALSTGAVYSAAGTVDQNKTKFAAAGLSPYYLTNYPQFALVVLGTNDGRSYYNSMQFTLRRQVGAVKFTANYTYSKSMDNISIEGNGFTGPIDNFNLGLNRARSDFDQPNSFNYGTTYTLPFGKGLRWGSNWNHFTDTLLGGWELGSVGLWHSGTPMTYTSGRNTGPDGGSWAMLNGADRNQGSPIRQGNGVYYFTPGAIGTLDNQTLAAGTAGSPFPVAGSVGDAGRNTLRGPRDLNIDVSLVKRFKITERVFMNFRAEVYNIFNNVNFNNPSLSATSATFGKITSTVTSSGFPSYKVAQLALRFDF